MDYVTAFNVIEVVLWSTIGFGFAVKVRQPKHRFRHLTASIGFLMFGLSDAVELHTGAWWRPWWLFVWKASCVVVLVGLAVYSHQSSSRARK